MESCRVLLLVSASASLASAQWGGWTWPPPPPEPPEYSYADLWNYDPRPPPPPHPPSPPPSPPPPPPPSPPPQPSTPPMPPAVPMLIQVFDGGHGKFPEATCVNPAATHAHGSVIAAQCCLPGADETGGDPLDKCMRFVQGSDSRAVVCVGGDPPRPTTFLEVRVLCMPRAMPCYAVLCHAMLC
jgi:hypothetical protein